MILGVSAFFLLRAFANGSSAMTGTEAISNGVSIFRKPQARNARTTLVLMSTILGVMFLGVSVLAALTHSVPFVSGTPTVVSEIGTLVYGSSPAGQVLYYSLQAATALILILAANTSFTGFPFLVSFVAEDSFLPRKLTVRGHRLVFSNGILLLAGASIALLLATGAKVAALIPMYGIGVFTGFTMAGAGMVTHHWRHRDQHWRQRVVVNGIAAVVCAVVVVVFAVSEFTKGAWVVVVVMPLLVYALITTNREYRAEDAVLERRGGRRGVRGEGAAPARRDGARGPHRPGHGPGHSVRACAHARRPARGALQHRQRPHGPAHRALAAPRPLEIAAGRGRLPGPTDRPGRAGAGRTRRDADRRDQ